MCLAKSWCKCGYTSLLKGSELVALQKLACEAMHGLGGSSRVCLDMDSSMVLTPEAQGVLLGLVSAILDRVNVA